MQWFSRTAFAVLVTTGGAAAQEFNYEEGPLTGQLGLAATIEVPAGFAFVDTANMPGFNAATGNLHNPNDLGAVYPLSDEEGWLLFFSFNPVGYVEDDDKDELDAEAMLESFKASDEPSNDERRRQGMAELHTVDWSRTPHYDTQTHNLTWGLRLRSDEGEILNHQVRVLGRRGVMEVILVASAQELEAASARLDTLLEDFAYTSGETYGEYRDGDMVAEYGLAGLVLGGGVFAAAKLGLLAKLGKFLKLIIVGVVALVAGIARWGKNLFGGRSRPAPETGADAPGT